MTPLILASLALAADPGEPPKLDIPAEIVPTGGRVYLKPKTDAVAVTYVGLDAVDPFPAEELRDPRTFLLDARCLKPGRYRFAAVAASEGGAQVRADFAVVVGDPPKPPAPGPTPPPGPSPSPADPLAKKFRDLLTADPGQHDVKVRQMADLAELYRQAVGFATADDSATVGAVVAKVQAARQTLGITGIAEVRKACSAELQAAFPSDDPLTPDTRAKLAALFGRLAGALTEAGK
jgi:hypothetical protein